MVYLVKGKDDFDQKLAEAGDKLVIVDFFAEWCGPCKFIAPKLEALSGEHQDVVFLKVDVDVCNDLVVEYEISSMPTFVFIKQQKKIDHFCGANETKLLESILKHK